MSGVKYWEDHKDHPAADWIAAVEAGDTRLGYHDWVAEQERLTEATRKLRLHWLDQLKAFTIAAEDLGRTWDLIDAEKLDPELSNSLSYPERWLDFSQTVLDIRAWFERQVNDNTEPDSIARAALKGSWR